MLPVTVPLLFAPTKQVIEAHIVEWNDAIADHVHEAWWIGHDLIDEFDPQPIDRNWNWDEFEIEMDGRTLASKRVAIVTGDGAVQGAMMISIEPIPSILTPTLGTLFIELLFTAPRNRIALRRDRQSFIVGVGQVLLTFAAKMSVE